MEIGVRVLRNRTSQVIDAAIERGLAIVTQDDDYDRIAAAHPALRVLKV